MASTKERVRISSEVVQARRDFRVLTKKIKELGTNGRFECEMPVGGTRVVLKKGSDGAIAVEYSNDFLEWNREYRIGRAGLLFLREKHSYTQSDSGIRIKEMVGERSADDIFDPQERSEFLAKGSEVVRLTLDYLSRVQK